MSRGLFDDQERSHQQAAMPLAARMRPRTLEEFVGQEHLLGEGGLLRRMLQARRLGSLLLCGPPGCGKTTLATMLSRESGSRFRRINATTCGVKELRGELETARDRLQGEGRTTVLFIDELHRFSRSQQDVLLPDVEDGTISLIGATTANPSFAVVAPLLSRSTVLELQPLDRQQIRRLLDAALIDRERGLGETGVPADEEALEFLAEVCDGDARRALNALEVAVLSLESSQGRQVTLEVAEDSVQRRAVRYDNDGDEHYDVASALIKSMRGSDPDAAIYWLAVMLEAGEDPRFIARRLMIAASEDVGNADPQALVVATSAARAVETVGMPEGRIILAQAVTYLASAPKSSAAYAAINAALEDVRQQRVFPVPPHLRDPRSTTGSRAAAGEYVSPHSHAEGFVPQEYLGVDRQYYQPVNRGHEAEFRRRLASLWPLRYGDTVDSGDGDSRDQAPSDGPAGR